MIKLVNLVIFNFIEIRKIKLIDSKRFHVMVS